MGEWEQEHPSWHLPELPPAHEWAPTARGGAASGAEERRVDTDGVAYTLAEFIEEYGGAKEWEAARRVVASGAGEAGEAPVLVWLRPGDMRLADNPALHAAATAKRLPRRGRCMLQPLPPQQPWPLPKIDFPLNF